MTVGLSSYSQNVKKQQMRDGINFTQDSFSQLASSPTIAPTESVKKDKPLNFLAASGWVAAAALGGLAIYLGHKKSSIGDLEKTLEKLLNDAKAKKNTHCI